MLFTETNGSVYRMLLWDCDGRSYSYYVAVSTNQQQWHTVTDRTKVQCKWVASLCTAMTTQNSLVYCIFASAVSKFHILWEHFLWHQDSQPIIYVTSTKPTWFDLLSASFQLSSSHSSVPSVSLPPFYLSVFFSLLCAFCLPAISLLVCLLTLLSPCHLSPYLSSHSSVPLPSLSLSVFFSLFCAISLLFCLPLTPWCLLSPCRLSTCLPSSHSSVPSVSLPFISLFVFLLLCAFCLLVCILLIPLCLLSPCHISPCLSSSHSLVPSVSWFYLNNVVCDLLHILCTVILYFLICVYNIECFWFAFVTEAADYHTNQSLSGWPIFSSSNSLYFCGV